MIRETVQINDDTTVTLTYNTLDEKIRILLEEWGYIYVPTAEEIDDSTNIQTLKENYLAAIARLEQIENAGTIPFTQTGFNQVVSAVKDMALIQKRLLKGIRKVFT